MRHILAILVRFQWVFKSLLNIFLALYPAIYVPKRLVTSVAIVFVATSTMRSESQTKDCGPRTWYKRETKVSGGLRTTDYGLRTGFKGELKSENHIFLVFILSKFNVYQIKFR